MNLLVFKALKIKNNKLYTLLIAFLIIITNIISICKNNISLKIDKEIIDKIENRIIYVQSNDYDKLSVISNLDNVEYVYYSKEPIIAKYKEDTYLVKYIDEELIKKKNLSFYGKLSPNQVIVPKKIVYDAKNSNNINLRIVTQYENDIFVNIYTYYDDELDSNTIYIGNKSILNKYFNSLEYNYLVVLKHKEDYKKIENKFRSIDCSLQYIGLENEEEFIIYREISTILNAFFLFFIVILFLIIYYLVRLYMNENIFNIAILKTFGYRTFLILFIITTYFFIVSSITNVFSILSFIFLDNIMNSYIYNKELITYTLSYNTLLLSLPFFINYILIVLKIKFTSISSMLKME